MSTKAWPLKNFFFFEKCYFLVENFDRKPAISLKTLEIGFFKTLL